MNPHACEFVPTQKMGSNELRKYEKNYLTEQITAKKNELTTQNAQLILLHNELNKDYAILAYEMNRSKQNEQGCYTNAQVDELHSKFTEQSQYYYTQYSKFNDVTSELITLQQKLHRLLMAPDTPTDSPTDTVQHPIDSLPTSPDGRDRDSSPFFPSPPSATNSYNALPPIMESDGECDAWNDENELESMTTNSVTISVTTDKESITCDDEKDKENIPPSNMLNQLHISITPKSANIIGDIEPLSEKKMNLNYERELEMEMNSGMQNNINYIEYENKINLMLDMVWKSDIKIICSEFNNFMITYCCNNKCIEILIDLIINHAIKSDVGNPKFFGAKYSQLCQSVVRFIKNNKLYNGNIYKIIWNVSYDTFCKYQFGNMTEKFIHTCIIIAELVNANLLNTSHIFHSIFKSILNKNKISNQNICENDIEGIYEIFKRCHGVLYTKNNKKFLIKYLKIMNNIKQWNKFQNGITRVPFMINQMQNLIKPNKNIRNKSNNNHYHRRY